MDFAVAEHQEQAASVICVRGELDSTTAPAVHDLLEAAFKRGANRVVLDLAEVTFLDSSGLAVIVAAHSEAKNRRAQFACVATEGVARRLVLWGLGHFVELAGDRNEALVRVTGSGG